MLKTLMTAALAAATLAGAGLATTGTQAAEGRHRAFGTGAAIGAIVGSQLNRDRYAEPDEVYVNEPRHCFVKRERIYTDDGDVITRRVRTCR